MQHDFPGHPVSVVIATYNGERFLEQQINSVLTQTIKPAEIIVCDDDSKDNTIAILEKFSNNHLLKYYRNAKRIGVVENFKKAVSLASPGNYIALCDQDDTWLPQKMEKSIEALAKIDDGISPAMIYSDLILIDSNEHVLNPSVDNELGHDKYQHCLETLLFGNFVLGCTVMMNESMRKFFSDIPNNKAFNHDAWITLIAFTLGKVARLDQPYIMYRSHDDNVTFSNHKKKNRIERIMTHLKAVFQKNDFLEKEVILFREFYHFYCNRLSGDQKKKIEKMIRLENASYLKKKIAFEAAFKDHWIKRF